jgi:hypothetical protein
MENKSQLLEKLGYSRDYLELLNNDKEKSVFEKDNSNTILFQSQVIDTKITTLIIDKTEKPINNRFIFNEK